jgi:serine/threonine protein kinase
MPVCSACHREASDGESICAGCGAVLPDQGEPVAPLVGATIAEKYFVHQLLGRGGMADVYKATDLESERQVALKVLRKSSLSNTEGVRRFEREAEAAARLRHPNSIELIDFGTEEDGSVYLAMEFIPGRTLARLLVEEAPLPGPRVVHIAAQILAALGEAHTLGIIHRDLKPANVMLDPLRDGTDFVKVVDYGIATLSEKAAAESRLTQQGMVYGTPAYMSPEQIRGETLDARSDLYSVGVMLFEMLSGSLPFEAPTPMAIAAKHLTDAPPRLTQRLKAAAITPELDALVDRALRKDREKRPASAEAMREELLSCLALYPETVRSPPVRELPATQVFDSAKVITSSSSRMAAVPARSRVPDTGAIRRKRRWRVALASLMAASAASASVLLATRHRGEASQEAQGIASLPPPQQLPHLAPLPRDGMEKREPLAIVAPTPELPRANPPTPEREKVVEAPPQRPARPVPAASPAFPSSPSSKDKKRAKPSDRYAKLVAAPPPVRVPPAPPPTHAPPIKVNRGELNSVSTPPAGTGDGVLVLEASPWAEMSLDGTPLGETPREVRIGAGTYVIRAVHPELGEKRDRVTVRPGERKLWAASFSP